MSNQSKIQEKQRCGSVAVLGLPNAGKSTLINGLVGEKVTITSRKAQTTRMQVKGIALEGDTQIILIDTPGVFKAKRNFDRSMVEAAWAGLDEADYCLLIVDVSKDGFIDTLRPIFKRLETSNKKKFLVLNKIDRIKRDKLLLATKQLTEQGIDFEEVFMISALKNDGVQFLKEKLAERMIEQPWIYDEDDVTDISQRVLAAEITREQIYDQLHDELPYSIHVETEQWENFDNGSIKLDQIVYVQTNSQKAIVLGKGGQQLRKLGERSRQELAILFGCQVHLSIFVKVKENWMRDTTLINQL